MSRGGFGVGAASVAQNEAEIKRLDTVLALAVLPERDDGDYLIHYVVRTEEIAAAFGLSRAEAAALDFFGDANAAWLADEPTVPGMYGAGKAIGARLEAHYGVRILTREGAKRCRATAVRRLRVAKNALTNV